MNEHLANFAGARSDDRAIVVLHRANRFIDVKRENCGFGIHDWIVQFRLIQSQTEQSVKWRL
jgi:hypothetical protein